MSIRKSLLLLLVGLLLASCGTALPTTTGTGPKVVATTTFLADIAQNVAGDRLQVESLLPNGADPHSYQPIPQDVAKVANSDLLITNGVNYEHFLTTVLENAGGKRTIIEASAGLKVLDANGGQAGDPHLWMDPTNVIGYVNNIRDGLAKIDPAGADVYASNAQAYIAKLQTLDSWIKEQVATIPAGRRLLVTNHENLGYFANRYGFKIVGTVIPGFSSEAAPSAQQMAALIDQIKASGVPAVFLDTTDSNTLADQVAADAHVTVVTNLHIESLTNGPPAGTYIDMMKDDVTIIVEALK
jgi:ABC-type Zn uptake system ZnuABC Zn-binding protein ZnuA